MSPFSERDLVSHATALRALARVLVGDQHADDLVQDATLSALHQQERPESLRGWLFAVLRRLAGKHRRSERRRQRRETTASGPEPEPSPARIAEHKDAMQRLTAALVELAEPYHRTLMLRYFEDLTPSQIAAKTKVPLATVKTRLQRGVAMLRARLEADHGEDWRPALAGTFGLGNAIATGVLLMGTGTKVIAGSVAAAAAIAALWLFSEPGAPGSGVTGAADQPAPTLVAAAASDPSDAGIVDRREAAGPPVPAAAMLATIRGRCLGEDEAAVDGAEVKVRLSRQGPPHTWQKVTETVTATDAGGRFAVRLPVMTGDRLFVEISSANWCSAASGVEAPAPGGEKELGDIVLCAAVRVRGVVVDEQGVPQPGVDVRLRPADHDDRRRWEPAQTHSGELTSREDGSFGPSPPLPSGLAWLQLPARSLARGSWLELRLDRHTPVAHVDVVVLSKEPEGVSGLVVDEAGEPVADAAIDADGLVVGSPRTGADGRFTINFLAQLAGPFRLEAEKEGFEPGERSSPVPRGAKDVRLVLRRACELTVRVVADMEGPLADQQVLVMTVGPHFNRLLDGKAIRTGADGNARIASLARGDYTVWVGPGDDRFAASKYVPVAVGPGHGGVVTIRLQPLRQRLLRVVCNGLPAAGVDVELMDPVGQPLQVSTHAFVPSEQRFSGIFQAPLVQTGRTDDRGELMLRGPGDRPLALRLRGSGVSLQIVPDVRLEDPAPLLAVAEAGARWSGRLQPPSVVAELLAMLQERREGSRSLGRRSLGLRLWRDPAELDRPGGDVAEVTADGTFAVAGIPSGTWQVTLQVGRSTWHCSQITLAAGQHVEQDLDILALRPTHLELQFNVDGKPLDRGTVNVLGRRVPGGESRLMADTGLHRTDGDGRVRLHTFGGRFEVHVSVPDRAGERRWVMPAWFDVPAGVKVERTVDVQVAERSLQVSTADGAPAVGAELQLTMAGVDEDRNGLRRVGPGGRLDLGPLAAGTYIVRARPRSLCEEGARVDYARKNGGQALESAWVELGTVEIAPGNVGAAIELRLPPEWDR